jgi:hypothetical protein
MSTTSIVLAVRAIAIEFARRIYVPVLIIFIVAALLVIIAVWWLVSISAWWWLLAVPLLFVTMVGAIVLSAVGVLFRLLGRTTTKSQREIVSNFVDSMQEASETLQTPKIYILFRLVKDIVRPNGEAYIRTVVNNTKTLGPRFKALVASF